MRIELTDNNLCGSNVFNRKDIDQLFPIADKTISELCAANENLLIFPHSIEESNDRIDGSTIFCIQNTSDSEKVCISTGNVMGFIGVGSLQIKIQSRFDVGRDDYLLHYMLQRVLSFNLFDLNHNNEQEDIFDFIMFMFPCLLKNALRQGVYREYKTFNHNDDRLCGTLNLSKHIAQNVPFVGNVAYSTREYCRDNAMTQLIRHTIEFMRTKRYGNTVLNMDRETKDNVEKIIGHTSSYNKCERLNVISKNLRYKSHPYYTAYKPLQSLCLQILRMEEFKYGESEEEICGILFDGAWLWEEYINTILCQYGFIHPQNKLGKGGIYLFEDIDGEGKKHRSGRRYPDFYKKDFVLDAKYKRLGSYEKVSKVGSEDVHQVIAYMKNLKASRGGFVCPLENKQEKIPTSRLKDSDSTLSIFGVEISKTADNYTDFCTQMSLKEKEFIGTLNI